MKDHDKLKLALAVVSAVQNYRAILVEENATKAEVDDAHQAMWAALADYEDIDTLETQLQARRVAAGLDRADLDSRPQPTRLPGGGS